MPPKNADLAVPLSGAEPEPEAAMEAGAVVTPTPQVSNGAGEHSREKSFGALRQNSGRMNQNQSEQELRLEWKDLSFNIGGKQIMKDVTGRVQPKRLTGVLGPSGSGKSTLLNVLAGRQRTNAAGMTFTGDILASGVKINPSSFRSNIAYVMQDDSLLGTETPLECLEFSAALRLPGSVSPAERKQYVDTLLGSLNLTKCKDTVVGSALIKGISGGERKRTSVGIELITHPKLLFLDEPLSGLDSYAAYTLVEAMKELAEAGVPVLCTVHQPSSEIFDMFDDVCFLHDGEVTYFGPVPMLPVHFRDLGFPCKSNFNPADHVMFVLQKEQDEQIRMIKDQWAQGKLNAEMAAAIDDSKQAAQSSNVSNMLRAIDEDTGKPGFFVTLAMLTRRELRGTLRNKGILGARFGMSIFLALLYAWLFAGSASAGDASGSTANCRAPPHFDSSTCASDFQAHYGTLVSLSISAMMGSAQPVLLSFPAERPVFLREYAAKQYGVIPYFISKTLIELPVVLASQLITFLIAYWIMGLHGNFALLVAYSWALGIASSSLALLIGCGVASAQKAIQLAPLALIPQMLFSGLFVPVQKIPASLRWVKWFVPLKYSISLLTMVEFQAVKDRVDDCERTSSPGACMLLIPGDYLRVNLVGSQSVSWDDWALDLVVLLALLVAFRIIAAVLLWRKGKYVY